MEKLFNYNHISELLKIVSKFFSYSHTYFWEKIFDYSHNFKAYNNSRNCSIIVTLILWKNYSTIITFQSFKKIRKIVRLSSHSFNGKKIYLTIVTHFQSFKKNV